jgi:hypothetical protein
MPLNIVRLRSGLGFICIFLVSSFCKLQGQVFIQTAEDGLKGKAATYIVYGSEGLSNKVPYYKVKGSPFWSDDYKLAALYSGNKRFSIRPIKLNLATNEIYFLKNDVELVLDKADVTKLVLYQGNDTSVTTALFHRKVPELFIKSLKVEDFVQVLNSGKYQLLKYIKRKVASADSLFGTQKRYFFRDEVYYFLRSNETIKRLKKLNKEELLSFIPSSSSFSEWIELNKIDFKKEQNVILFLNYYNSSQQQKNP